MAIMSFKKDIVVDFVPAYGGNRQDKIKTIIGIKPMNNDGAIDFMDNQTRKLLEGETDNEKAQISKEVAKQAFIDHIAYVKNYDVVGEDGKKVKITTGEALYNDASKALINEISFAIENSSRLSEGQLKNWSGRSAGLKK